MEIKFKKQDITSINESLKTRVTGQDAKINVPTEESFTYVLNKAMSGNEMAAVQIAEWNCFCKPGNSREQMVLARIRKATDDIFE